MGVADGVEAGGGGGGGVGGDDDTPSWQLGKPRPLSWHTVACKITDRTVRFGDVLFVPPYLRSALLSWFCLRHYQSLSAA